MRLRFSLLCFTLWCLSTLALATAPSLTSFTPTSGAVGQKVILYGSSFTTATGVQFNGLAASYSVVNAAYITTIVPVGATSGMITITTSGGTSHSATAFTVNAPPTITSIANQATNVNVSTAALAFTVGDDWTAVSALTVTGVSSNKTLLPPIWLVFGGAGSARTLIVKPGVGQSGTATITLTVKDGGGLTTTTSFTVTVNAPPTITTIASQLIYMGTATPALAFTVTDAQTAASALKVTGVASNASLVKPAGLLLTGPNDQGLCSLTVTPAQTYFNGLTSITLTVTDGGGLTAKTSFLLTVNRPTISAIANQTVAVSTPTAALAFTVGDSITPVTSLTVSGASNLFALVPNASIVFGGSDAARTVIVTPVAGKSGTATISLTVKDAAGLTATTRFTVTVAALPGTPGTNATDGASLVWVPGGSFTMGSTVAQDNGFASQGETQQVMLSGYWMYKNPVTVAQYCAFCAATSRAFPPYPTDFTPWSQNTNWTGTVGNLQQTPIVNVTWADCTAYATWAGVQLSTEAQYEYAARGPSGNNYPWGGTANAADPYNGWDQPKCANYYNSYALGKGTWPVGSFPAGASWCGAQDMAGNVWEWCADWRGEYSSTPVTNPTGPIRGSDRVLRGGSWGGDYNGDVSRGAYRNSSTPAYYSVYLGFRCTSVSPRP